MVSPLILAPVTPEPTENTADAAFPFTVTRLVRLEPLPLVAPVMAVFEGMVSVPLLKVMVFAAAELADLKVEPLKLMFPAPALAAASSASRRRQAESTEFVPGVACAVQLLALPESSFAVFTT